MKIVDIHVYIGESLYGLSQNDTVVLQSMDEIGISQSVLITNKPVNYSLPDGNRNVYRIVQKHRDRFFGISRIDPWQREKALDDLRRCKEEYGFVGLLLHPFEEVFHINDPIVNSLVEYATEQKMFVMIEAGYPLVSHPFDIAEIANRYKDTTFIATHGLQLDSAAYALTDAEYVMRECPNLIMETSGMYAPTVVERIVHDLGMDRVVFGSHSPWLHQRFETDRISRLRVTDEEREMIFTGTFSKLLQ